MICCLADDSWKGRQRDCHEIMNALDMDLQKYILKLHLKGAIFKGSANLRIKSKTIVYATVRVEKFGFLKV